MKKNVWERLESHPEIYLGQYIVPNFISNSVALELSPEEHLVISPGEPLLSSWPFACPPEDSTLHIVMPNSFHYMGVNAWRKRFAKHTLYAHKGAIKRLTTKLALDKSEICALQETTPPLPNEYCFLFPPGHRAHDAWLKKDNGDNSSLWVTCDSFLNYDKVSNQPVARTLQKLLDAAPGLKISQVVKWLILSERKEFKPWVLRQLELDKPTTLIPSHGEVKQCSDLKEQLSSLVAERL